jgi:hypothetical protein
MLKYWKSSDCFWLYSAVIKTIKTGKFTSIYWCDHENSQEIVDKYLEVSTIEGIISFIKHNFDVFPRLVNW